MTVLFVDDERQVLRGIERMLDAADFDQDVEFATSMLDAMELLANDPTIDTVVTDMRMPGFDGAELLKKVSEKYPHIVRIVLSGQADRDEVFRAIKPMHQYLAKPCEPEVLTATIRRASALRDVLQSDKLRDFIGGMANLPSVPAVYQELVDATSGDDVSVEDIGDIVGKDIAMTAKVLQLANSAVFGLRQPVTTAARAAVILGIETLKALVLSAGVFKEYEGQSCEGFSIDDLMSHSLAVADASKAIASKQGLSKEDADLAFTAGILHDVGKLALFAAAPKQFKEAIQHSIAEEIRLEEAEAERFGADHASVGAHVLSMWGIPQSVIEVVAMHHRPIEARENEFSIMTAVVAANEIVSGREVELVDEEGRFAEYLQSIGQTVNVESWLEVAKGDASKTR